MLFNSVHFLAFFPIVCLLYFIVPVRARGLILLAASYYFYMAWEATYIILILLSTVVDFIAGQKIATSTKVSTKRWFLALSVAANLGILFTFKYFNFFADNVEVVVRGLGMTYLVPHLDVLLPVGISFYTFQTMSYTIDVYRGQCEVETRFLRFALYVSFFPQLVAGPIERASSLLPQFRTPERSHFDFDRTVSGVQKMAWGFFKKVVVADRLAPIVDAVYSNPDQHSGGVLLVATYAFAFQIYCDFSGYSDIAIGAARILGFDLMENFKAPYFSKSVEEFWRRWHISLSTWFRDYVYIPLGGNRVSSGRTYFNVFVVFVVSGFWHGANWTFIVWGALHGAYLITARLFKSPKAAFSAALERNRLGWLGAGVSVVVCFHLVLLAWVFFRAANVEAATTIITKIAADFPASASGLVASLSRLPSMSPFKIAATAAMTGIMLVIDAHKYTPFTIFRFTHASPQLRQLAYATLLMLIMYFGAFSDESQFIYFQF